MSGGSEVTCFQVWIRAQAHVEVPSHIAGLGPSLSF